MIKYYFIIQCYERREDNGTLTDTTSVELVDSNAKSALTRAKEIIKKSFYRISSVIEKSEHDHA